MRESSEKTGTRGSSRDDDSGDERAWGTFVSVSVRSMETVLLSPWFAFALPGVCLQKIIRDGNRLFFIAGVPHGGRCGGGAGL